jgi:hypothetical protein
VLNKIVHEIRNRHFDKWIGAYAKQLARRPLQSRHRGPRHLLFALCDHYEPLWGGVDTERGSRRVAAWSEHYPKLASAFRDDDGHPPRHSFFFPGEEIALDYLDRLADLAKLGLGEVELHMHHDGDTSASVREKLELYLQQLAAAGHLSRDDDGRLRYAFIHGNWCLANARSDGRWCGVDDELQILFDTGCYADFTFPAAPDESQPGIINQIYWPTGDLSRRRAFDTGRRASVGEHERDRLLMIQGPLSLLLRPEKLPVRIENGQLTGGDPCTPERLRAWVAQDVHIEGRPEWLFLKTHTHGAPEENAVSLLHDGGRSLHRLLRNLCDHRGWRLHYVTAREMFNIARAAMDGETGDPNQFRDYILRPPPAAV